jgi:hypothetical protein
MVMVKGVDKLALPPGSVISYPLENVSIIYKNERDAFLIFSVSIHYELHSKHTSFWVFLMNNFSKTQFVLKGQFLLKNYMVRLGMVVHTCNPSHTGGGDQEDRVLSPAQVESETPISTQKLTHVYLSSCEKLESRITVQAHPGENRDPI